MTYAFPARFYVTVTDENIEHYGSVGAAVAAIKDQYEYFKSTHDDSELSGTVTVDWRGVPLKVSE